MTSFYPGETLARADPLLYGHGLGQIPGLVWIDALVDRGIVADQLTDDDGFKDGEDIVYLGNTEVDVADGRIRDLFPR